MQVALVLTNRQQLSQGLPVRRAQSEGPGPGFSHTNALLFPPHCSQEKGLGERPESQGRDHSVACR